MNPAPQLYILCNQDNLTRTPKGMLSRSLPGDTLCAAQGGYDYHMILLCTLAAKENWGDEIHLKVKHTVIYLYHNF